MGYFDGKVAVVTGAGGGLGRAHAMLLASEGAKVVVNDYGGDSGGNRGDSAMAESVVEEITAAGGEAVADSSDVALEGGQVIRTAVEAFGMVHLLINNAGIAGGGTIDSIPVEAFDRMLAIHLGGTLAVTRAAWPYLREQGYGRIVNTSSVSVFGLPGTPSYITAKAGIFGLTRALGHDGRGIGVTVNAVMPSAFSRLTAQSPEFAPVMERGFPPEKAAPFVCSLLTDQVPCNGETFIVGGGRAARVVLATAKGLEGADSIATCLDRFDEALSLDELYIPEDAMHEVIYECQRIGLDLEAIAGG
jgi:NAD(P)-dependent dehydrogenase (short-subunit alcohol dehydrogenase family)